MCTVLLPPGVNPTAVKYIIYIYIICDELITRPEESYRLWCVVVCDLETSRMRRPRPALGRSATEEKLRARVYIYIYIYLYLFIYLFISPLPRKNMHFSVSVVFCLVTTISITRASVKGENRLTNWRIINPCIQDHENSLGHLSAFLGWKDLERCLNYGGQLQVATAAA